MQTEDAPQLEDVQALRVELEAARAELREIRAGVAWRVLSSYRRIARQAAPTGSRRGHAYDVLTRAARQSIGRLRPGPPPAQPVATSSPGPLTPAPEPEVADATGVAGPPGADTWFTEHYDSAASRVVELLAAEGITLEGKQVADIGAGDGILDLGLVHKGRPARLVGYDVNPTAADLDVLLKAARDQGVCDELPESLQFAVSGPTSIPAPDGSFDVIVSWSAFEHIGDSLGVLREVRRVIREDGVLFVQVWPFYHSQFGSHLRDWFPEGWEHLQRSPEEIEAVVRASNLHAPSWADVMLREFAELNKITVDDLGRALVDAGFRVTRLNLLSREVPLPAEGAARLPLSVLGIEGVELTAVPVALPPS